MKFKAVQFSRKGKIYSKATIPEVFPLLCPKKEEEWIPGWECETIWSKSGYNEEAAIFRTTKPYGTELYWVTLRYDLNSKIVDFLITAPYLFMLRYRITLKEGKKRSVVIIFSQVFTSISEQGNVFIKRYKKDNFNEKMNNLEDLMNRYLSEKKDKSKR